MPKIIFTSRFIKNPAKSNAGKLLKYMGTRESAEKMNVGIDNSPSTVRQQRLINEIVKSFPESKEYLEYEDYDNNSSKSNAAKFVDAVLERNIDRIDGMKNLVKYYAERPSVEKLGSHGLFSQSDNKIDLEKVADEVSNHNGTVWTHVISLRREDAERLNYNNASRWRDLVRSNVTEIAEAHNIDLDNLRWYGAFHNKDHHPHIHLMIYSADGKQGWITKKGIDDMRSLFGNAIFRNEQYRIFEMQTQSRDKIKRMIDELMKQYEQNGFEMSIKLDNLFSKLTEQLKTVKGKKVYGYLPKEVKKTVDEIVSEIAKDGNIAKLYAEWNDINRKKLSLYHEKKEPDIPLEDNKEFRSIKNTIIKTALEFTSTQVNSAAPQSNHVSSSAGKMVCALLRMISQSYSKKDNKLSRQVDKKLRDKIIEKKLAHGQKPEQSDCQNDWEQSM